MTVISAIVLVALLAAWIYRPQRVYLCGGINGLSDADCTDWRDLVKRLSSWKTLDPMRRDYRGREMSCVTEIVFRDLLDILWCKALIVNACRPSWGTAMEMVYARLLGKRIIAVVPAGAKVSPWLVAHSSQIAFSFEAAAEEL